MLAACITLIGLVLVVGGLWLTVLGGSRYYVLAGYCLAAAGALIFMRRFKGALLYCVVVALTIVWAFWEVRANGWALVPRVIAPLVLLMPVLAALPALGPRRVRASRAWLGIAAVVVLAGLGGWAVTASATSTLFRAVPAPDGGAMSEPSLQEVGSDWPAYGETYSARRFSPFNQINRENVGQLERVWLAHPGDLSQSKFAQNKYGAENTPLRIGDSLYVCRPKNIIISYHAATGEERWRYDPKVLDENIPYTAACRGVVYFEMPDAAADAACARRIIEGTFDARLVAVDAANGQPCADFGGDVQVSTSENMGDIVPDMVSITSAPTIVRGVVVVGHQVLDGQKRDAPSGAIKGFDAVTGEMRWAWDMTQPDLPTPTPADAIYTRGTPNMWTTATGDEQLGYVYLPMGNSAVDYWSGMRSETENRYSTSLTAIDVTADRPPWSFQTVHKDVWDYDLGSQATLIDFRTRDGTVPALILPSKQGDLYILDRRTGQPLTSVEERAVPQGGVEPEQRSPTQPFSTFHTLRKPKLTEASMWGMSPIDQMICRIQFLQAHYEGFYTPPTSDTYWAQYPGYDGGSDWGGVSVDPRRGIIIANYNDMPNHNRLVPREEPDEQDRVPRDQERGGNLSDSGGVEGAGDPQAGTPYAIDVNAGWRMPFTNLLCKEPPYGGIRAIDLATGETFWDRPFGQAFNNGPFCIPSMLPISIGTLNNGGSVVTAGGLIFIAAATDGLFRAIDIETGETVWQDSLPTGGQATPMAYEVEGRQFVVIMTGGHHFMEHRQEMR